jgi:hypothetical protein
MNANLEQMKGVTENVGPPVSEGLSRKEEAGMETVQEETEAGIMLGLE